MNLDEYFELGYIVKSVGLEGYLSAHIEADDPSAYDKLESIFLLVEGSLVPFFIEHLKIKGDKAKIKFVGYDSIEKIDALLRAKAYLPINQLPKLKKDQFYYHDIIGYSVHDGDTVLGTVKDVFSLPAQDTIMMEYQGKEVLIPILEDVVRKVDKKNGVVHTELPDGLLDIYLNS